MGIFSAGSAGVTIVPDFSHAQEAIGRWFASRSATMHINVDIDQKKLKEASLKAADFLTGFSTTGKAVKELFSPKVMGITDLVGAAGSLVATLSQAAGAAALIPAGIVAAAAPIATVTLGVQGMGAAFKAIKSGDVTKINAAMKNLAPSARDFVSQIHALGPAWKDLRLDVQQRLFAGLGTSISQLAHSYLPVLHSGLGNISASLNSVAQGFVRTLNQKANVTALSDTLNNVAKATGIAGTGMSAFAQVFLTIAHVGSTFLPQLAQGFSNIASSVERWVQNAAKSGQLANIIQTGLARIKQLFDLVLNVGQTVFLIFKPAIASGQFLLTVVQTLFGNLNDFLSAPTTQSTLLQFFTDISTAVAKIEPGIENLIKSLVTNFLPIVSKLADALAPLANQILNQLATMLDKLGPLIYPALVNALTAWLNAVSPLIPIFTEIAQAILPVLAKVLGQLAPVIGQIAAQFGQFLAKALIMLAPLLQELGVAFVQIVKALLPILPPIFQLIQSLLPPFIKLMQAIIPVIVLIIKTIAPFIAQLVTALTPAIRILAGIVAWAFQKIIGPVIVWLVTHVVKPYFDIIIGALHGLGFIWGEVVKGIQTAWHWLGGEVGRIYHGFIVPVWEALHTALSTLKGWFDQTVKGVASIWHGLIHALEYPVQLAINWVWNDTLRKAWNAFNNLWHGKDLGPITLPGMDAAEGAVVPGYTPGRDVHHFYSPTGGRLNLSGGEAIMVPEFTRAVGAGRIHAWNRTARRNGPDAMRRELGFARGGVFPDPAAAVGPGIGLGPRSTAWEVAMPLIALLGGPGGTGIDLAISAWRKKETAASGDKGSSPIFSIVGSMLRNSLNGLWDWAKGMITDFFAPGKPGYQQFAGSAAASSKVGGGFAPGPAGIQQAVLAAAAAYGWDKGAEWTAIQWIISHESGWRPTAQNPSSTAYGLFQFLNSTWGSVGGSKTSDPFLQSVYGMRYFKSRYGDPINAQHFWAAHGYYDTGGWLPPGYSLSFNGTGRPERILDAAQSDRLTYVLSGASGGSTGPGMPTVVAGIKDSNIYVTDLAELERVQRRGARRALSSLGVRG